MQSCNGHHRWTIQQRRIIMMNLSQATKAADDLTATYKKITMQSRLGYGDGRWAAKQIITDIAPWLADCVDFSLGWDQDQLILPLMEHGEVCPTCGRAIKTGTHHIEVRSHIAHLAVDVTKIRRRCEDALRKTNNSQVIIRLAVELGVKID
jgi:hypothetical protein